MIMLATALLILLALLQCTAQFSARSLENASGSGAFGDPKQSRDLVHRQSLDAAKPERLLLLRIEFTSDQIEKGFLSLFPYYGLVRAGGGGGEIVRLDSVVLEEAHRPERAHASVARDGEEPRRETGPSAERTE